MHTLVLGLNHRTAPVELRERLAFSRDAAASALLLFKQLFPDAEAALLSTCNRVELLVSSKSPIDPAQLLTFLGKARNLPVTDFKNHIHHVSGRQAVRHLFRVICGLESMVLGEAQIVNQLKQAYQLAHEQSTAGPIIHKLFHHAFGVSKRVRTETLVDEGKTSISSVAVDLLRKLPPASNPRKILLIGAGEMAQLVAQYLSSHNCGKLTITTRTLQNARLLAETSCGTAVPFDHIDSQLLSADVVLTATTCPASILTNQRLFRAMQLRNYKPLLLIDLSVPRNIDADASTIPGITLYDVDALGNIVEESRRTRHAAIEQSEQIIEVEIDAFEKWLAQSSVRPVIDQMVSDVRALAEIEVRAMLRKCPDLTDKQREAVNQLADRIVGKLMHPCVCAVRQEGLNPSTATLANAFHTTRLAVTT